MIDLNHREPGRFCAASFRRIPRRLGLAIAASLSLTIVAACSADRSTSTRDGGSTVDANARADAPKSDLRRADANVQADARTQADAPGIDAAPPKRVPKKHRPKAIVCDKVRKVPEPTVPPGAPNKCLKHVDCKAGLNGRCTSSRMGYECTYDQCFEDKGCKGTAVCACGGGFRSDANACLPSGCRINADCGTGGYCSPSFGSCGNYTGVVAYFCHTPQDECLDDENCAHLGTGGLGKPYCMYSKSAGRWKCSKSHCAG